MAANNEGLIKSLREFIQNPTPSQEYWTTRRCVIDALKTYANDVLAPTDIDVVCATWNVGEGKSRSVGRLTKMLHLDREPHIVVIGLEEVDMRAAAIMGSSTKGSEWNQSLSRELGSRYVCIFTTQLGGLMMEVYIRTDVVHLVKQVAAVNVATGSYGMKNKGGIALRMSMCGKKFCFVASHFAAHRESWSKRNENYYQMLKYMTLPRPRDFLEELLDTTKNSAVPNIVQADLGKWSLHEPMGSILHTHDYVFWVGDLNYRLNLPTNEVFRKIDSNDFVGLLKYDQLSLSRDNREVFNGFEEEAIDFAPTYKYDVGSDVYDTSKKSRTPSYTDRILHFTQRQSKAMEDICSSHVLRNELTVHAYGRHEFHLSDHRPVSLLATTRCLQLHEANTAQLMAQLAAIAPRFFGNPADFFHNRVVQLYKKMKPARSAVLEGYLRAGMTADVILESLQKEGLPVTNDGYVATEALSNMEQSEERERTKIILDSSEAVQRLAITHITLMGEKVAMLNPHDDAEKEGQGVKQSASPVRPSSNFGWGRTTSVLVKSEEKSRGPSLMSEEEEIEEEDAVVTKKGGKKRVKLARRASAAGQLYLDISDESGSSDDDLGFSDDDNDPSEVLHLKADVLKLLRAKAEMHMADQEAMEAVSQVLASPKGRKHGNSVSFSSTTGAAESLNQPKNVSSITLDGQDNQTPPGSPHSRRVMSFIAARDQEAGTWRTLEMLCRVSVEERVRRSGLQLAKEAPKDVSVETKDAAGKDGEQAGDGGEKKPAKTKKSSEPHKTPDEEARHAAIEKALRPLKLPAPARAPALRYWLSFLTPDRTESMFLVKRIEQEAAIMEQRKRVLEAYQVRKEVSEEALEKAIEKSKAIFDTTTQWKRSREKKLTVKRAKQLKEEMEEVRPWKKSFELTRAQKTKDSQMEKQLKKSAKRAEVLYERTRARYSQSYSPVRQKSVVAEDALLTYTPLINRTSKSDEITTPFLERTDADIQGRRERKERRQKMREEELRATQYDNLTGQEFFVPNSEIMVRVPLDKTKRYGPYKMVPLRKLRREERARELRRMGIMFVPPVRETVRRRTMDESLEQVQLMEKRMVERARKLDKVRKKDEDELQESMQSRPVMSKRSAATVKALQQAGKRVPLTHKASQYYAEQEIQRRLDDGMTLEEIMKEQQRAEAEKAAAKAAADKKRGGFKWSPSHQPIASPDENGALGDRCIDWLEARKQRLEEHRLAMENYESNKCTFKPQISRLSQKIMTEKRSQYEQQAMNHAADGFAHLDDDVAAEDGYLRHDSLEHHGGGRGNIHSPNQGGVGSHRRQVPAMQYSTPSPPAPNTTQPSVSFSTVLSPTIEYFEDEIIRPLRYGRSSGGAASTAGLPTRAAERPSSDTAAYASLTAHWASLEVAGLPAGNDYEADGVGAYRDPSAVSAALSRDTDVAELTGLLREWRELAQ